MRSCFIGAVLPLVLVVSGFASKGLTADQSRILKSAQDSALQYTQKLPDFICIQVTHRTISPMSLSNPLSGIAGVSSGAGPAGLPDASGGGAGNGSDVIEERLTFFQEKEHYEVIAVDGKKMSVEHMDFPGAISIGEFGTALHDIFDEKSHTVFTWDRMEKVRGKRAYVFGFRVPRESGMTVIHKDSGQKIVAGYTGKIFIDGSSMEVLRLSFELELPGDFPVRSSEKSIEYESTEIAGKSYMLPYRSEVRMLDNSHLYVNKIDFKNYQKFAVESTIHYDGGEPH